MFKYRDNGFFQFINNQETHVTEAFSVAVRLNAAQSQIMLAQDGYEQSEGSDRTGAYQATTCFFKDETDCIHVRLVFRQYSDVLLAAVEAETVNSNDFGTQLTFASENGIELTFRPAAPILGVLANYQHKDWWTRPYFGTDPSSLPARTQSLLWKTESNYYHLLPVVSSKFRVDAAGSPDGYVLRISSFQGGHRSCETLVFAFAGGGAPHNLIKRNAASALKALEYPTLPRESKVYPAILDKLGWCSWDAFYHKVDEEGLFTKAEELKQLGLPVGWVMIDDGWSAIEDSKLMDFEADSKKFPQGLAHTISILKESYGIKHVGVWHTIVGYWGGVHPNSNIARELHDSLLLVPRGNLIPYPDAGRGFGFWHAWHSYLKRQGVDFVKVDSQSAILNYLKEQRSIGEASAAAHQALEASVALHFDNAIINCMGMASENIWHRPKSAVSRNSDDFVPQEKRGFPEHALQNAYNSIYHGAFYWGDWDMYWTKNHDDVQNAVLRSISGGPVYFSDAPGNTDPAKIWPLIYKDGTIIRCDGTPSPTEDSLLSDPTEQALPLKLWNTAGGAGVVAAFHIHKDSAAVTGSIGPADVPGLEGKSFAVYEHFSRQTALIGADDRLPIQLAEGGYALYTLVPMSGSAAPIGLTDKYISSHAVHSMRDESNHTVITLREGGAFVFAAKAAPVHVLCNGKLVKVSMLGESFYEVDAQTAEGEATIVINWG
ncbi:hypothetical protein FHS16_000629 [Paenibacillus endophyticus]|uniref:Raffinose synthase Sip1-like protein n=1 Tax=Paenibacillus endophyticus TaxID=1294268 RepID=A0A7W5G8F5_9BACL|nr:Sip1-related alpha-galactosidase [Paenibacillus endophyticus]MBB3150595.1 hypothetical protein [Paenibacillus endophyticus]